jgi:hypothetical protein
MFSRATLIRALVLPCALTMVLAGCSSPTRTPTASGKARIPAICKKFATAEEQQQCAGRWQVAQDDCKREEAASKAAAKDNKNAIAAAKKFSLSKCITKKMNLAASAAKPNGARASAPSGTASSAPSRPTPPASTRSAPARTTTNS